MYASLNKSSMSFSVQSRVGNACKNIIISFIVVSFISLKEICTNLPENPSLQAVQTI